MVKILTGSQVSQFHKNGFLPAFPVLPVDQAVQLRANLESFEAENDGVLKGSLRFKNHLLFKWLSDLIRSPIILDAVEDIIGPDLHEVLELLDVVVVGGQHPGVAQELGSLLVVEVHVGGDDAELEVDVRLFDAQDEGLEAVRDPSLLLCHGVAVVDDPEDVDGRGRFLPEHVGVRVAGDVLIALARRQQQDHGSPPGA